MKKLKITVVGGGNMGLAFARGLIRAQVVERKNLLIVDRSIMRKAFIAKELKCETSELCTETIAKSDVVVIAVKPQDAFPLLNSLSQFIRRGQLVISMMTGIKLAQLSAVLGGHRRIVRSMPNLPVHVRKGVTIFKSLINLSSGEKELLDRIFSSSGVAFEVKREGLLDAATAYTGTGPGYLFYFFEHMMRAAQKLGFSSRDADRFLKETVRGTLELWTKTELSPRELRQRVTSKGGTTNAAIKEFDRGKMGQLIVRGIFAADRRAKELSRSVK